MDENEQNNINEKIVEEVVHIEFHDDNKEKIAEIDLTAKEFKDLEISAAFDETPLDEYLLKIVTRPFDEKE